VYFESLLETNYGNPQGMAEVFESMQWNCQRDNCIWSLWTQEKVLFDQGPFCNYVSEWDDAEPRMDSMMLGVINLDQSAVMICGANRSVNETAESVAHGLAHNVGWWANEQFCQVLQSQRVLLIVLASMKFSQECYCRRQVHRVMKRKKRHRDVTPAIIHSFDRLCIFLWCTSSHNRLSVPR
jgi:hypothetical protein